MVAFLGWQVLPSFPHLSCGYHIQIEKESTHLRGKLMVLFAQMSLASGTLDSDYQTEG